jgi:hypothetical protein
VGSGVGWPGSTVGGGTVGVNDGGGTVPVGRIGVAEPVPDGAGVLGGGVVGRVDGGGVDVRLPVGRGLGDFVGVGDGFGFVPTTTTAPRMPDVAVPWVEQK